ncbi:MAG: uracil-DNA glycosylase [Bacillota bacterium]|nr:uracil-DNA glycosylase [Bacillota bacterium]MDW7676129.1 uracil-DNA glycosylase [Bacillota bacterium]
MSILKNDWAPLLNPEFSKPYYESLRTFLKEEYRTGTVYPDMHDIFNALHYTPYQHVKVVILGQDPYHGPGQAHGLCFSVKPGIDAPPSLVNIFKELETDLGFPRPDHGCLIPWARRGVLLLNTALTVRAGQAASHRGMGWERFTDRVIDLVNTHETPVVFFLWGKHAQEKLSLISNPHHLVLESPHPSPLSAPRGFFGSRPFSRANAFLMENDRSPINWKLPMLSEVRRKSGEPESPLE